MWTKPHTLSAGQTARLLGRWQRQNATYIDLATSIRVLIEDGRLPIDTRIPAERVLAAQCGISRNSVSAAYRLLREQGYLRSHRGAGSFITLPETPHRNWTVSWAPAETHAGVIDLGVAMVPAPEPALTEAVQKAAVDLIDYSDKGGYDLVGIPALRNAIAAHYTRRGLPTTADEIMVTVGAHHAWGLLLRLLMGRQRRVLVDSPTYPNAVEAIRSIGGQPMSIGVTNEGWDVDLLASAMRQVRPTLGYLMTDYHNPIGLSMPEAHRKAIASAARLSGTYLVVDETLADLSLDGEEPVPSMASFGSRSSVILIGSLSKTCWGGLRLGWLRAAPPLIDRLAAMRGSSDAGNPIFQQLIARNLLTSYGDMLAERRQMLRGRRDALVKALHYRLPGWRFRIPSGGLVLWIDLDTQSSTDLSLHAPKHGVRVLAGSRFGTDGTLDNFLRLPFALDPATLREGVDRLALAFAEVTGARLSAGTDPARHTATTGPQH